MVTRLVGATAVGVFTVGVLVGAASAFQEPIPTKISLLKWGGNPRVGKLYKIVSNALVPPFPIPAPGPGDPSVLGGSLSVTVGAGELICDLEPGNWKGLGSPAGSKGWKYVNTAAPVGDPCKIVIIKETVIKVLAKGVGSITPPYPSGNPDVFVVLAAGSDEYCALATGPHNMEKFGTLIKMKEEPAPPDCEPPPTTTTTTLPPTTTTSTTSTTITTTSTTTTTLPRFVDNGDGTITDNQTGLVWEKKSADLSVHDYTNQYSWCSPPPDCKLDNGTVFINFLKKLNDKCDGNELKACTDDSDCTGIGSGLCGFAGHRDWRLPETGRDGGGAELDSLLDLSQGAPPYISDEFNSSCVSDCTVSTCSCTNPSYTWSITDYAFDPLDLDVWVVNFGSGYVNPDGKDGGLYARAVRGVPYTTTTTTTTLGGTTTTTLPRFVDNDDGTITDDLTGLMWEKKSYDGSVHDFQYQHTWCQQPPLDCFLPDGQVFEYHLFLLNNACDSVGLVTLCTDDSDCIGIGNGLCGFAGYRDWRVPEVGRDLGTSELDTLLDLSKGSAPYVFDDFNSSCTLGCSVTTCSCPSPDFTWSSTVYAFPPPGQLDVWVVNFGDGYVVPRGKNDSGFVRAVRGP